MLDLFCKKTSRNQLHDVCRVLAFTPFALIATRAIWSYIKSSVMHAFWLVLTYDLLDDRRIDDVIIKTFFPYILILYYIKQRDSKLPCVCSVIDHRGRQNVVRTSIQHEAQPSVPPMFLPHFDVLCDLLLNRRTATWYLFVKQVSISRLIR